MVSPSCRHVTLAVTVSPRRANPQTPTIRTPRPTPGPQASRSDFSRSIRQCAVGFRTGDDQSHHSGRPHHRVPHEQDHHPRTWSGRYDHVATDVGGQHFDIRQITNECFGRDCAPPVVFGLSHAHLRAVTLSGRFTSSGDDSGARPGSAEPGARQRVVLTRTRRLELCRGAGRLSLIGQVRRSIDLPPINR